MPTPEKPLDAAAGPSSAGSTGSQPELEPQQEARKTDQGVEFLHAGSGNSLGDGRTAGGSANIAARDALPDTNADTLERPDENEDADDGSNPRGAQP